jgi:hypothetical protein
MFMPKFHPWVDNRSLPLQGVSGNQMKMVGYETVGVHLPVGRLACLSQGLDEILPVGVWRVFILSFRTNQNLVTFTIRRNIMNDYYFRMNICAS